MNRDDSLCWFHGKLTREAAEELLKQEAQEDGTFLIRESNTAVGDFVLTLLYQGEVCHYQIRRHGEDAFFSIDDKIKILHGLETLVEFYQQAANGLVTKLSTYIKKDPPPHDARSHGSSNLFHRATQGNSQTVVSEMLKCGYRNLDAKNQDGQTAVHLAALHCDETILKLLLEKEVNVNCMDTAGNMPLHYACRTKPASFVRTLIEAGANVQGRNIKNGHVPLHDAAEHGNLDAVKELLEARAPLLPRTSFGEFPIDLAKSAGQTEVVNFLENYKVPPPSTNRLYWYHGTLKREEAVEVLKAYAAGIEAKAQMMQDHSGAAMEPTVDLRHEDTSQKPATATIEESASSGCFLIRYSERKTAGSGYVLTLLWDKEVKHFIIINASNYLYIDDGPYLPSLEHLVEHFMHFSDGLPVRLKVPVPPKPKPPLPLFSTMPRTPQKRASDHALVTGTPPHASSGKETPRKHSLDAHKATTVGEKHAATLATKKKHKDQSAGSSVFNTLRLRSPKKSLIMDGMSSLRLTKTKQQQQVSKQSEMTVKSNQDELKNAAVLLKTLTFNTDFSAKGGEPMSPGAAVAGAVDGFYNVPRNNSAIGLLETAGQVDGEVDGMASVDVVLSYIPEQKTEAEVEYFTKSDVAIERERANAVLESCENRQATNINGYIPTVDIRIFHDANAETQHFTTGELREHFQHPQRMDSLLSTASTESEIIRYLNRQNSNGSNITQCSETATASLPRINYFIPADRLELNTIIGEGEFGSVYKGWLQPAKPGAERCEVAIKTLRDEHCRRNKQEFLREASVMIHLQHHCIVKLLGISKGEALMMIQELVPLGSMLQYILEHRKSIKPNNELKLWASQIACGMEYLESQHFVHRDLAARNILLASRHQAKISDFGLSRALGSDNDCYQASQGGKWPIKWYAPESFNNGLFSHASDVWSFGVTLWEMFSLGEPPFGDKRGVEAIQLIESGARLPQPPLCPDHVYSIMRNCWMYRPKDRPTFHYLTEFFAKDPDYQNIMELVKTDHIS